MELTKKKQAQMKMLETVAVIIIFFFLVSFGFNFYAKIKMGSIAKENAYFRELNFIEKTNTIYYMPEIECPPSIEEVNCFDRIKLEAATNVIKNNFVDYAEKYGYMNITVDDVSSGESWNIYSRVKNDTKTSKMSFRTPVKIYDPISKDNSFGIVIIEYYYNQ